MSMKTAEDIVEIRTTFGSRDEAEACAVRLVEGRFAACVQVEGPIRSVYRWRSAVERAEEFRCICKTAVDRAEACLEAVRRAHPYETPELILAAVSAAPDYAAWVRSSVERP
ncbi:MAG: Divalent-cation tolerance protein CutA [Planctomycetota bacterium]|jgi:periplasmic divalent cation tolerance protein